MGAVNFYCETWGKTARSAFNYLVEEHLYEYGHGGYSGTIAEKNDFVECPAPPRISAVKWSEWIEDPNNKKINPKHKDKIREINEIYEDKWGPAVCVPLKGAELAKRKEKFGLKGKRLGYFVFVGMASE